MSALRLFKIKKEERWMALAVLFIAVAFNALVIYSHYSVYTMGAHGGFWTIFLKNFRLSGYDCWSWITVSGMRIHFETVRHPLYLSILYPFYLLNHWMIEQLGTNFAVFFMAGVLVVSTVYSAVFMYRIMREVVGLKPFDARLLTFLLFSFAHVMLPMMAPDHFIISLMLLLMTLYIAGRKMKERKPMGTWQTFGLMFFTAGISASNGVKVLLASLFANGRRFFRWKNLLVGILLPLGILVGIQQAQYYAFEVPQKEVAHKIERANLKKNAKKFKAQLAERKAWLDAHTGRAAFDSRVGKWMDVSTSRTETLKENFFGESFQLHQNYLLKDVSWDRPIFVPYNWTANYIIEGFIVLLFLLSSLIACRERFFAMLLAWFAFDVTLHIIMGFGINEVYIMTAGWAFIVPIALGYTMRALAYGPRRVMRILLVALTLWLWIYNGGQIAMYLLG